MTSIAPRYLAMAALIIFGVAAISLGITVGHADDAPGAGMLGIILFIGSLFVAFRIYRRGA